MNQIMALFSCFNDAFHTLLDFRVKTNTHMNHNKPQPNQKHHISPNNIFYLVVVKPSYRKVLLKTFRFRGLWLIDTPENVKC